jgi:hypothetical protein
MHAVEVRSRPSFANRTTRAELTSLAAHVEFVCPLLRAPRTIAWSETPALVLDGEVPWVFGPVERDPLRGGRGTSVLPRSARARLIKIAAYGVPFQRVTIAHELDPDGPVQELLPELSADPRPCTDETARRLVGAVPGHPGVSRAVRLLDQAIYGAASTAIGPGQLFRKVLDPIIFGVVAARPLRPDDLALWYPLTAWRW